MDRARNTGEESLFRVETNCCAVAKAGRAAYIVDAKDYFSAFMAAAEKARRSIVILAWDFDSRITLNPDGTVTVQVASVTANCSHS